MQNDQPVHEIIIDKKIRGTMRKIGAEQVRKVAWTQYRTTEYKYREKKLKEQEDAYSPFSGNDVDRITGSNIPFCTNSSLLARTEIFLSSAINKDKENEHERHYAVCSVIRSAV